MDDYTSKLVLSRRTMAFRNCIRLSSSKEEKINFESALNSDDDEKQLTRFKQFLTALHRSALRAQAGEMVRNKLICLMDGQLSPSDFCHAFENIPEFPIKPSVVPFLQKSLAVIGKRIDAANLPLFIDCIFSNDSDGLKSRSSECSTRKRKQSINTEDSSKCVDHLPGISSSNISTNSQACRSWSSYEEEWRRIESLFNMTVSSVDHLLQSMLLFQQRIRFGHPCLQTTTNSADLIQRRADLAVQKLKKVAVHELKTAMIAAEKKTIALMAAEKERTERRIQEINRQEDNIRNCWNCGRQAGLACSICSMARYCGSFCQHKHWDKHGLVCCGTKYSNVKMEQSSPPNRCSPSTSPKSI